MYVPDAIIQQDQSWLLYLNRLGNSSWDSFWLYMTHIETWIPAYVVLILLIYHLWGWRRATITLVFIGLLILCADQTSNLIKHAVKRYRPCWDPVIGDQVRLVQGFFGGKYGFSSGHAANHFALAFFLGKILHPYARYAIFLLLMWAGMIAYSRVYIGVHYPLDILSGALLGLGLGFAFNKLYTKFFFVF
ncbi:MAG: phosphatase PAP2 family protein [Flavobacteriales bacterium]